jgi:hypothetical protein
LRIFEVSAGLDRVSLLGQQSSEGERGVNEFRRAGDGLAQGSACCITLA